LWWREPEREILPTLEERHRRRAIVMVPDIPSTSRR